MGKLEKPSEEFIRAICHSGTVVATCELCGTTLFAPDAVSCFEQGELEDLQKKAKDNPEKYQELGYDTIEFGNFNGKQIVPGHSPECDRKIAQYEEWVLSHRYTLASYLNARRKKIVHDAVSDARMTKVTAPSAKADGFRSLTGTTVQPDSLY